MQRLHPLTAAILQCFILSAGFAVARADDPEMGLAFEQPDEEGTPEGWRRVLRKGTGSAKVAEHPGRTELQTVTTAGLLRFEHDLDVTPMDDLRISWDWKVDKMPATPEYKPWNDDGRKAPYRTNSPIQVLVVFRERFSVYVIHYLWEPTVEVGYTWREKETQRVVVNFDYIRTVVQSGREKMQDWHSHERDLIADFKKFYPGKTPPKIIMVAIQCASCYAGEDETIESRASISNLRLIRK
ncbi:MAG: DUF3047 domain-containing protein [Deltaproteobacteria bacterium]